MELPLRILPGDGIVVRSGPFVGAAPGDFASAAAQRVETIFASYEQGTDAWENLVRSIATSIIEANFDHPPVLAAQVEATSMRVFVYGATTLSIAVSTGESHVLDGASTSTWIDQVIDGELVTMSAGDPQALGADLSGARGALLAGVVPGAGFAVTASSAVPKAVQVATEAASKNKTPTQSQGFDSEQRPDSEATIEPAPLPETVADAASTLLADPEPPAAPVVASRKLDQEFRPDVTATIGPNELAEIRAAVAAHPKSNPTPEPAATSAPPPPPPPNPVPEYVDNAPPPPPPVEAPTISAPTANPDDGTEIDLRDLPPPPANHDRRTPALSPDTLSVERSPYAPPINEAAAPSDPPAPAKQSTKRRGIFAAVPDPRDTSPVETGAVTVAGVRCPQGHLNRMQSSSCAICGSAIDPSSAIEQGERPALGQLRFDDGQLYPLDRPYVLGRRPESSAPGIGIIVLDDERHMVSKRHAEIRIVGWDVKIVDLGSSNGTKVFPPGGSAQQAIRLRPNVEVVLEAGSHIQVGERTFQYLTEGSR